MGNKFFIVKSAETRSLDIVMTYNVGRQKINCNICYTFERKTELRRRWNDEIIDALQLYKNSKIENS